MCSRVLFFLNAYHLRNDQIIEYVEKRVLLIKETKQFRRITHFWLHFAKMSAFDYEYKEKGTLSFTQSHTWTVTARQKNISNTSVISWLQWRKLRSFFIFIYMIMQKEDLTSHQAFSTVFGTKVSGLLSSQLCLRAVIHAWGAHHCASGKAINSDSLTEQHAHLRLKSISSSSPGCFHG